MSEQRRAFLLETFAAMAAAAATTWPALLRECAARQALAVQWHGPLSEAPEIAAIRVGHAVDMGAAGIQGWCAAWPEAPGEPPALHLAAAVARLLAGREGLLVLAATTAGGAAEVIGALVDGESCARMAVAGFDAETEIRLGNLAELLQAAGDCITLEDAAVVRGEPTRYLILGMKWHAPAGH